jgi:hypothetical protein
MAALQSHNDFVNRIGGNYYKNQPMGREQAVAVTAAITGTGSGTGHRCADTEALPSLPAGVTAFIATMAELYNSTNGLGQLICRVTNLGTFDISNTTVGTFTDGSAMPTQTVMNTASTSLSSSVLVEVTTATTGTQTVTTVTYKNQSGTGAQTTTFTPVTSAAVNSVSTLALGGTDWGVQDITAVARSASAGPTGVLKFWGVTPLAYFSNGTNMIVTDNLISCGVNITRLSAADTIVGFCFGSTAVKKCDGRIYFVGDS